MKAWLDKAKGPPLSARNPIDPPALSLPTSVREMAEGIEALEKALDDACATASAPAGAGALADADDDAGAAREELTNALLDLAADATVAAEWLRRATDKLEQHGEFRRPAQIRSNFDKRLREAWQAPRSWARPSG